jgi:hypothetical protein
MDSQTIINFAFTTAGFFGGWILKVIWDEIKLLQKNQQVIEHDINTNYVRKDDYRVDIAEVKGMLARIFDKLDGKADK